MSSILLTVSSCMKSSPPCAFGFFPLLFPHLYIKYVRDQRKVGMILDRAISPPSFSSSSSIFSLHLLGVGSHPAGVLAAPLSRWPPALLRLALLIISGHCYRHLCSSHWPPAGDAGLFCCSTCGHPAARARGSKGTLRNLPAPKPTPAGRAGRTSPRTATTSLLSEGRDGKGGGRKDREWMR